MTFLGGIKKMKHNNRWIVVILVLAAVLLVACGGQGPEQAGTEEEEPAVVELLDGTELNRVTLTARAAERLGIETTPVRMEVVTRQRTFGGVVEARPDAAEDTSIVRVRVPLNLNDMELLAPGQSALVMPLYDDEDNGDDDDELLGLTGQEVVEDDLDDTEPDDLEDGSVIVFYDVENTDQRLALGDKVGVRLSLAGSGEERVVIPDSAVIYDLNGETWTYVSPEPLVFHRAPITIDYVQDGLAVLSDGPEVGTEVATVGVPELYGADTGVGK
jgi:multidrug efflux pump subunit AcrA (membrane-fusion protein)